MNTRVLKTVALTGITLMLTLNAATGYGDISVSGSHTWTYTDSSDNGNNSATGENDTSTSFKFSNETDNGLTISVPMRGSEGGGSEGGGSDELVISGGFGTLIFGGNDVGLSQTSGLAMADDVGKVSSDYAGTSYTGASANGADTLSYAMVNTAAGLSIYDASSDTSLGMFVPAMGGYNGNTVTHSSNEADSAGAMYSMDASGVTITIGYSGGAVTANSSNEASSIGISYPSSDVISVGYTSGNASSGKSAMEADSASAKSISYALATRITATPVTATPDYTIFAHGSGGSTDSSGSHTTVSLDVSF